MVVSVPRINQHVVSIQLIEMVQLRGYSALAEQLRLCPACRLRCPGIPRCPTKVSDHTHAGGEIHAAPDLKFHSSGDLSQWSHTVYLSLRLYTQNNPRFGGRNCATVRDSYPKTPLPATSPQQKGRAVWH